MIKVWCKNKKLGNIYYGNFSHLSVVYYLGIFYLLCIKLRKLNTNYFKLFIHFYIRRIVNSLRSWLPFLNFSYIAKRATNFRTFNKIDTIKYSISENSINFFFLKKKISFGNRFYSTNSSKSEFNYENYKNPELIVDDFYFLSQSIEKMENINFNYTGYSYYRINSITNELIPVDEFGIDIPTIIIRNAVLSKYLKLWAFRINISDFPNGTAEYLKLNPNTEVHDLELGMRFGLLYYYALIREIEKNEELFNSLNNLIHFDENLFSPELIDFCIQKWSAFFNFKKKKNSTKLIRSNYNKLGIALGLDLKHSILKKKNNNNLNDSLNSSEIFFELEFDYSDYTSLLSEINFFLKKKS